MASAGRILIIPKGDYDANSTYDNLDLVNHNGMSWLAKKTTKGIEPTEENTEYWQKMFEVNIANNLITETGGYALDARQGKVLDDKISISAFMKSWRYPEGNPSIKDVNNGCYAIQSTEYMPIEFVNTEGKTSAYGSIIVANNTIYPCAIIVTTDGKLWAYDSQNNVFK